MASPESSRTSSWRTMRAALVMVAVSAVLAWVFDSWYRGVLVSRERQRVLAAAAPYAGAMESAVGRRISRLSGLATFVQTRPSAAELEVEFDLFAAGVRVGVSGIRALELVRNGRIVAVVPREGNENVLGYDLYADARPFIPGDVRRAIETGAITISGPTTLVQGGFGMIVRQRITRSEAGFPDLVTMVIDVPALVTEAAAFERPDRISFVVLDRTGQRVSGQSTPLDDPVSMPIRIPDGAWRLTAAPANGWAAAVSTDLQPTRIASGVIAMLLAWLTYLVAGSQQRLRAAVVEQTRDLRDTNDALTLQVREREAAEQRLREQSERLRLALSSGQMATWDYQPASDRLHLSVEALAILGTPDARQEMRGRVFRDALAPEARDAVQHAVRLAIEHGEFRIEYRNAQPPNEDRWLYCAGELQTDPDGTRRLVGVVMDVTDRRRLEEQLLHSQKMEAVGTLAGGIAHDFNNLLTAILGFAQLSIQQSDALQGASTKEAQSRAVHDLRLDLEEILKAGERASLLTAQLLAFSRRQVVTPIRVDLNGVVHDVERMLQRLIGERITLVTRPSPSPLHVRADAGQMAQVVVNLVVNARDAMPDGGTIRVTTESMVHAESSEGLFKGLPAGRWNVLTVSDDGVGMTPDVVSRMFEPFFTTKRVGEGTGLGLSTVYGIVAQVGGQIFVESAPGLGTTVRVALPWNAEPDRRPHAPAADDDIADGGIRVLVVEDEPGLQRLTAEILSRRGYQVEVARDGQEALEVLDRGGARPDLVLTDVVMPRLGGPALANELARRGFVVPVLFMSGYPAGEEIPADARYGFIAKPFTPDALVRKVREVLEPS